MAEKLAVLFDLDLLLNVETLRRCVQLKPLQVMFRVLLSNRTVCLDDAFSSERLKVVFFLQYLLAVIYTFWCFNEKMPK